MKKILLCFITSFALLNAHSQGGSFDPSFAGKGWTAANIIKGNFDDEDGIQVLLQTDGSYIVVYNVNYYTVLAHFTRNGAFDTKFGTGGYSDPVFISGANAALQSDGKIVVAGEAYYAYSTNRTGDFGLARYTTTGALDSSFGVNGKQTTDFSFSNDLANALAIQPDGKIVVAGYVDNPTNGTFDFGLARYTTTGALDSSFGVNGKRTTDFFGSEDEAYALSIQPDGKIVVIGAVYNYNTENTDFGLARYNSNGSLDKSFGVNGKQTTDFFGDYDYAYALAIQLDGKIVVGGNTYNPVTNNYSDFALARYNSNGSLNKSFGVNGKQTTDFSNDSDDFAYALAIQPDGKIVVVGWTFNISTDNRDIALARYNSNGSLDNNFAGDGKQTTDFSGDNDYFHSIAIQPDGKIVVAGTAYNTDKNNTDFALVRYNTNGTLDKNFDRDGKQDGFHPVGSTTFSAIAIQPDGKIVVAGRTYNPNNGTTDFALVRYNTDGSQDKNFDQDGKQTTDFFSGDDYAYALAIQPDGKIVVGGNTYNLNSGNSDFALVRYTTTGSLDNTFGNNGLVTTDFFGGDDNASSLAIQLDGKIVMAGGASNPNNGSSDFALVRYTTTGVLDNNFAGDGKQTTNFGFDDNASSLAIQPDGKIVVAGWINNNGTTDFALARYNSNGTLNKNFDQDGKQTTDFGFTDIDLAYALAIQPDGKIVVAGSSFDTSSHTFDFGLARYTTTGALDSSFGVNGKQTTDFFSGYDEAYALTVHNNRIYIAGSSDEYATRGIVAAYLTGATTLAAPAITSIAALKNPQPLTQKLTVSVLPNPSAQYFTLKLQSSGSSSTVTVNITDAGGRLIETKTNVNANSSLQLGHNYPPGIYFAQIVQGNKKEVVKLIKQ